MAARYKMLRNIAQSCPGKARGEIRGRILAPNWVLTMELWGFIRFPVIASFGLCKGKLGKKIQSVCLLCNVLIDFSSCAVIVLTNQLIELLNERWLKQQWIWHLPPQWTAAEQIWCSFSQALPLQHGGLSECSWWGSAGRWGSPPSPAVCLSAWAGVSALCQGGPSPTPGRAQTSVPSTQGCQLPQLGPARAFL